jgi:hypothetical protein
MAILHYRRLGNFVNIDDTWPTPDENGDYPDDRDDEDNILVTDVVDEDKEEVDPDSDEEDQEDTLCTDDAEFGSLVLRAHLGVA